MIKVFGSKTGSEELAYVQQALTNQWLGAGPFVKKFESKFSDKIRQKNFLMIDNASNGLLMALKLLNLPARSEVIVPSFTWIACAHAISLCNCVPVFCDIDRDTQNVTAATVAACISTKTKAIIVVHYAGLPVDIDPILELGPPVVEDAAHAADSFYKGRHCGTLGAIGVFSYDSMKNIAAGECGGLTCQSGEYIERAFQMRLCGMGQSAHHQSSTKNNKWWEQEASEVSIKMNPSDITAAVALAQLEKLSALQLRRKEIWDIYQKELSGIGDITLPRELYAGIETGHSYFTFLIRTSHRDDLANYLLEKGIYTTLRFYPIHMMKLYKTQKKLIDTELIAQTGLNLPLHPDLSENEVGQVVTAIKTFFS